MNFKSVHLFAIGASIGLVILGLLTKFQLFTSFPQDKWLYPFVVGVVFLAFEYLIQRKPR